MGGWLICYLDRKWLVSGGKSSSVQMLSGTGRYNLRYTVRYEAPGHSSRGKLGQSYSNGGNLAAV